jgi:hypothetical protein
MAFSRVLFVKQTGSSGPNKTIKVMKTFFKLFCCSLFLFAGIMGMKSSFPDVLPTQQVAAEPVNKLPVLQYMGQPVQNSNVSTTTVRDTIYVDSSSVKKQVINQQTPKVRNASKKHPVRVIYKTKTRTKSCVYVAIPRDGKKVTLDSILNDTANWQVHSATCLSTPKNLRHFVRD